MSVGRDLKLIVRRLCKQPVFALAAVTTLMLGVGPTTAVFSVVNGVLIRPLPYHDPERLAIVRMDFGGTLGHPGISQAEATNFRDQADLIEDLGAVQIEHTAVVTVSDSAPEYVQISRVTPNLFGMLGVEPSLGRLFLPGEGTPDQTPVAIISHRLWQQRFGADPAVIGDQIRIGEDAADVVGVLPPGFRLLLGPRTRVSEEIDIWRPFVLDPTPRRSWAMRTIVRIRDGATLVGAQAELNGISRRFVAEHADVYQDATISFLLHSLHDDLVEQSRAAILSLWGAVAMVFLIACTNAAGLLVARMKAREQEFAVRIALGAGRGRLMREAFLESTFIATLAGILGLASGWLLITVFLRMESLPLPLTDRISLDRGVLVFTLVTTFLVSVLCGVLPALQASRPRACASMSSVRGGVGVVSMRCRHALVVAQIALSATLLIGAGLVIRSFVELQRVDLGFDPADVVVMQVPLDTTDRNDEARWSLYRDLLVRIQGLPSVSAAGGTSIVPLSGAIQKVGVRMDAGPGMAPLEVQVDTRWVLPGYFESMGMRLLEGRLLDERDNDQVVARAVVDDLFASTAWPAGSAVGKRFTTASFGPNDGVFEVVGVIAHPRIHDVRQRTGPQMYVPYRLSASGSTWLTVRSKMSPQAALAAVEQQTIEVGTSRPVRGMRPMSTFVEDQIEGDQLALILMSGLAGVALLLAAVGVYSLIAFLVGQRVRETGIRLALGAQRQDVVRPTLREGLVLAAVGISLGLVGAIGLGGYLESQLFGVTATDPVTFLGTTLVLGLTAALATYFPARRAGAIEPRSALREG